jgi:hypothetical protein
VDRLLSQLSVCLSRRYVVCIPFLSSLLLDLYARSHTSFFWVSHVFSFSPATAKHPQHANEVSLSERLGPSSGERSYFLFLIASTKTGPRLSPSYLHLLPRCRASTLRLFPPDSSLQLDGDLRYGGVSLTKRMRRTSIKEGRAPLRTRSAARLSRRLSSPTLAGGTALAPPPPGPSFSQERCC